MANKTFEDVRRAAVQALSAANIEDADIDARVLLMHAGGLTRSGLIVQSRDIMPASVLARFNTCLARRLTHEPIAHIVGTKEFWSLEFKVSSQVLIPRPETEGVVSRALALMKHVKSPRILDIGTGSGAILIALLSERKDASGVGVDISQAALDIAESNANALGVSDRCTFHTSNFLDEVEGRFDILVSNPPYITHTAMQTLPKTVQAYEPHLALHGGVDGLDPYRSILTHAHRVLTPLASLVFEIGFDQGDALKALLQDTGCENITVEPDLAGHERIVSAKICVF
ncbi:MAG: protein-(glutamine-N5) methyltransferase, release factor-specific [Robiginitomaculum sp.]|nr:MAG: protein-(glutamine-N5) methyltransferase, release factor-specific [Robiginitomaculum sp.]